jgi:hypothetical protein
LASEVPLKFKLPKVFFPPAMQAAHDKQGPDRVISTKGIGKLDVEAR